MLEPVWVSGDMDMPDPAVIANGVVLRAQYRVE